MYLHFTRIMEKNETLFHNPKYLFTLALSFSYVNVFFLADFSELLFSGETVFLFSFFFVRISA